MAKRRINKKFLGFLCGGALAIAVLGVGALRLKAHFFVEHPEKYVAAGRDALAKKNYSVARDNLMHAAALSHPDASLSVLIGDAVNGLSCKDPDNVAAARGMWEQALTIDSNNVAAMSRLIQFWRDELELHPRPAERAQAAQQMKKIADKLRAADPDNHLAIVASNEALIEMVLGGIQEDSSQIAAAQDALIKAGSDDPADADIPYYVARSLLWQAQDAGSSNDQASQARLSDRAKQVMAAATRDQPDNAMMHYRNGQLLLQLASGDVGKEEVSAETKAMVSSGVTEVDEARQMIAPEDPRYLDVNLYDARLALERPSYTPNAPRAGTLPLTTTTAPANAAQTLSTSLTPPENRPARVLVAESIYQDVLAHRPNDPATRIALADLLGDLPGRRDEAIALLSKRLVEDNPVPGLKGTLLPVYQNEANIRLLALQIDAIEASRDPAKKQDLLAAADALCDRVYGRSPDSAMVLGLKGRLELAHGRVVDATQTLQHALTLTDPQDLNQQRRRYELMFHLACADEIAQQTGDAKKLASQIVAVYSHFIPARLMLARLLITEHDYARAKTQIDYLESLVPFNPQLATSVARMRVVTLDPIQDADKIKGYYNRLPEDTRQEMMDKASLARLVKYNDDAIRLLTLVHASSPGDVEAAAQLATWYQAQNQKPKALEILKEALATNPSDTNLLALQMQMEEKGSPGDAAAQDNTNGKAPDPGEAFNREVAQIDVARSRGDAAAVDAHLAAAEAINPSSPLVWDGMFTRALETSNWDRASVYLEKLATANADHAGGLIYRVRYSLARSDTQKAQEQALQLTREKPQFSQSWAVLGLVQKSEGNDEDAITSFQQALDRQVQNLEAIRGIVDCCYAIGNIPKAKQFIDMGRRVAPWNQSFKELSLNYELTYGDPQNVIVPRTQAMEASPNDEQAWLNVANAYVAAAQARRKAQDAAAAADYTDKAKTLLQQAVAKFPDSPKSSMFLAKLDLDSGDFPSAERVMLNLTGSRPQNGGAEGAIQLCNFYDMAGKPDQAAKILSDYLADASHSADQKGQIAVELRLSSLLASLNRFDDALAALSANSKELPIVSQRVGLLINAGRAAQAEKMLDDLAAVTPLNPDLLSLKGVAAMNSDKLSVARDCFDQVIAARPADADAHTERAKVMLREEPPDFISAIADLTRARDLAPQNMDTRLLIVEVDRRRAQPDEAIKELESAIHVAPTNKRVRLTLIDLYYKSQPPRWADAERVLRDTHEIPSLTDDPDFTHEEAAMDLNRQQFVKADALIRQAMGKAPGNLGMVHTYYDILLRTHGFDQLLAHSDQLLAADQNAPSLWWVYPYRAEAMVRGTGDKAGAAAELQNGMTAAAAAHDADGAGQVLHSYATLIGVDEAIKVAGDRAQTDPHWFLLAAKLSAQKGDVDGAVTWLETAMSRMDKLSRQDQAEVLRLAAAEYLAKTPPDTLKSADTYRQIIKQSPNDMDSLNNLACILVEPGPAYQPREALDYSERAYNRMVSSGVDQPLIKDTYGWTLIANGRSEEGLSLVQEALGKRDFAEGHYHLAEALLKRQPPSAEDAASELAKAMQMLDQAERDGKPVDDALKSHVQEELKRARSELAG